MLRMAFVLTMVWSLQAQAHAQSCRGVDYSAVLGAPRHQGETGWCYAHTAADLLTQHLGVRISAVDLAAAYLLTDLDTVSGSSEFYIRTKKWRLEDAQAYSQRRIYSDRGLYFIGGLDQDAILMAETRGFCADAALPGGPREFAGHMREVRRIWNDSRRREDCLARSRTQIRTIGSMPSPLSQDMARVFQCYVDARCGARIKERVAADTLDLAEDVDHFYAAVKSGRLDIGHAQNVLFKKIDSLLDQGKIVSMGFDAADVYDGDGSGADHAVTITGRKEVGGECWYRLRDNYGADCYDYRKGFGGHCDRVNGGTWFKKGQIPSMYGLVWIR